MIIYKVEEEGSDDDGKWSSSRCYSTFEGALEKFNKRYQEIIDDINNEKDNDENPDIDKTLTHFSTYVESMNYFSISLDIAKEELDSGISRFLDESEGKQILEDIQKEKRIKDPALCWPGMEVWNADL